jgi:hypothetical protein
MCPLFEGLLYNYVPMKKGVLSLKVYYIIMSNQPDLRHNHTMTIKQSCPTNLIFGIITGWYMSSKSCWISLGKETPSVGSVSTSKAYSLRRLLLPAEDTLGSAEPGRCRPDLEQNEQRMSLVVQLTSTSVQGAVPSVLTRTAGAVPSVLTRIAGAVPSVLTRIAGAVPSVLTRIAGAVPSVLTIAGAVPSVLTRIAGAVPSVLTRIAGAVPSVLTRIADAVPSVLTRIAGAVRLVCKSSQTW